MAGLIPERIGQVVEAHNLTESEADAATKFAIDAINMMAERHMSDKTVACALELLAHLRNDHLAQGRHATPCFPYHELAIRAAHLADAPPLSSLERRWLQCRNLIILDAEVHHPRIGPHGEGMRVWSRLSVGILI